MTPAALDVGRCDEETTRCQCSSKSDHAPPSGDATRAPKEVQRPVMLACVHGLDGAGSSCLESMSGETIASVLLLLLLVVVARLMPRRKEVCEATSMVMMAFDPRGTECTAADVGLEWKRSASRNACWMRW